MKKRANVFMIIFGVIVLSGYLIYVLLHTYTITIKYYAPCWSPDGKKIAFFMEKKVLKTYHYRIAADTDELSTDLWLCTMDYDGKNMKRIAKMPGIDISYWKYDNSIDWHSLDRFVLSMACKGVWIFNLVTNDLKKILDGSVDGYQANVVWNKEGDRIAYSWIEKKEGEFTRESYICDLKRNTTQKILDKSKNPLFNPTDSNRIACTEVDAVASGTSLGMRLVNISDGGVKEIGEKYQGAQKWSPDGKWLILAGGHSKINIETGEERGIGHEYNGGGLLSPDEKFNLSDRGYNSRIRIGYIDKSQYDENSTFVEKKGIGIRRKIYLMAKMRYWIWEKENGLQ